MPVLTKEVQENLNYRVVHSIPGRIRIRISRLVNDSEYGNNLQHLIQALDFVSYVRINPAASSLVVEYNFNNQGFTETIEEQIFQAIASAEKLPTQAEEITQEKLAAITNPGIAPRHHLQRR
ncbi:HMA2 domain-containing protein [Aerosakkonemataceae cyanobacterium BLCC-F154]|uniref:HMA2 domain-containing protein n=1 Tax=Floridaenema fluviatile BLCC-F154 TaxID=3153640 RepID=A0ABV4YLG8_9CYAN